MRFAVYSVIASLLIATTGQCQNGNYPTSSTFVPTPDRPPSEITVTEQQRPGIFKGESPEDAIPLEDNATVSPHKKLLPKDSKASKLALTVKNGQLVSITDPKTHTNFRLVEIPKKGSGSKY